MKFKLHRSDGNRSLKAWTAAEEHSLNFLGESFERNLKILIMNENYGFYNCNLSEHQVHNYILSASQKHSISFNVERFRQETDLNFIYPFENNKHKFDLILIKTPKSLQLLEFLLNEAAALLETDGCVICSFMTRHFTNNILSISNRFFENSNQSKAYKKSRLLILKNKKALISSTDFINTYTFNQKIYKQYYGVFSSKKIDNASEALLNYIQSIKLNAPYLLDLCAGNGILGLESLKHLGAASVDFMEDHLLALESIRLNASKIDGNIFWDYTSTNLPRNQYDLILCNPPFHFEYEKSISPAKKLIKEAIPALKKGGHFIIVANKHLNYQTLMDRYLLKKSILLLKKYIILHYIKPQN